ncbi:hypothetical protein CYMTET_29823 [Cymbomonas tetramitiformis]|uniref:Nudix hydrolase domain-containing protein n=1 Tax=Cymbomonas tetramitiformis TaxID=36881 RepID=A0AAE0FK10_9CHLO|nr:hypothetical protein CYMTET_29823 [Cymbomonas tetramitiformis]|eukprot:gene25476-31119_t
MSASRLPIKESKVKDFRIVSSWDAKEFHYGVGVGVIVVSDEYPGCVLLGKRKGSDGAGQWALPGGHLMFGEELEAAAVRELKEETTLDLDVPTSQVVHWDNSIEPHDDYHYITAFVKCQVLPDRQGVYPSVVNTEPDKCEGWYWKDWEELARGNPPRSELFTGLRNMKDKGFSPFSSSEPACKSRSPSLGIMAFGTSALALGVFIGCQYVRSLHHR